MTDQQMAKADFATSLLLMAGSTAIIMLSLRMPRMEEFGANPYSAPGVVPGFLGAILLLLGGILFIRSIMRQGHRLNIAAGDVAGFFRQESVRRVLLTLGLSLLYGIGFLGTIPYVAATFLYVAAFILLFEYIPQKPWQQQLRTIIFAVVQAILTTAVVASVFRYLFLVKLP